MRACGPSISLSRPTYFNCEASSENLDRRLNDTSCRLKGVGIEAVTTMSGDRADSMAFLRFKLGESSLR